MLISYIMYFLYFTQSFPKQNAGKDTVKGIKKTIEQPIDITLK